MMNMTEAVQRLQELYPGKYQAAAVEITTHSDGKKLALCTLYVEELKHHRAPTWEGAFASLAGAERKESEVLELIA